MKQTFTEAVGAVSPLNGAIDGSARTKPRKAPAKPARGAVVTSGIVCFCGERFSEDQALEFMKHLRAELGRDLAILERQRKRWRERYAADPEKFREKQRARSSRSRADPEKRRRAAERARLRDTGEVAPERPRSAEVKERDAKAAGLRKRGWSYRKIARELDLSVNGAYSAVRRGTFRQD